MYVLLYLSFLCFSCFPEYNATQLHKFVIGTLETVCKAWAEDVPLITVPNKLLEMSFQAIKNTRRKMEDSHTFVHDLNTLFGLEVLSLHLCYTLFPLTHFSLETLKRVHHNLLIILLLGSKA